MVSGVFYQREQLFLVLVQLHAGVRVDVLVSLDVDVFVRLFRVTIMISQRLPRICRQSQSD